MVAEVAWRASARGAIRTGIETDGAGYEATQRRRRADAVQRDTRDPHAHTEDRHPRRVRRGRRIHVRFLSRSGISTIDGIARASLPTGRRPIEAASPDV